MPLQIHARNDVLSIARSDTEAYFFDHAGRCFATWDQGWFIRHGLSGRSVARRWDQGQRSVRALTPEELLRLERRTQQVLRDALQEKESADIHLQVGRCLEHDRAGDLAAFRSVYHPVGILPPDQYNACVVQVTEGCGWNQCHFCSFYRHQLYRVKTRSEIKMHNRNISAYYADGLSLRRSIFLGEANALAAPLDDLLFAMETARRDLIPRMPHFRGFYSFNEVMDSSCRTAQDFKALAAAGLRRVYYGLETGDPHLRSRLGKPGNLPAITESIQNAKAAGVRVALILLVGAGGAAGAEEHVRQSINYIRGLPIDSGDILFLSPLYGPDGTRQPPLYPTDMQSQMGQLRQSLADKVRVATYDIREFVY